MTQPKRIPAQRKLSALLSGCAKVIDNLATLALDELNAMVDTDLRHQRRTRLKGQRQSNNP